jgi:hypothetical protein
MQADNGCAITLGVGCAVVEVADNEITGRDQPGADRGDRQAIGIAATFDRVARRTDRGEGVQRAEDRWIDGH